MSELLREIEEDIRSERLENFWRRFGKSAIRVSIAVVIGTAIGVAWQHYRHSVASERTSQLIQGYIYKQEGNDKAAIAVYDKIDQSSVQGHMAALGKADMLKAQGNGVVAQAVYADLAKENGDPFAQLGRLLSAKETDAPLTISRDSVFYYSASEMRGWQLLKAGNKMDAIEIFSGLRDDQEAPPEMRARAGMVAEYLEVK